MENINFVCVCSSNTETRQQSSREQRGFKRSAAALGQRTVQQEECLQGKTKKNGATSTSLKTNVCFGAIIQKTSNSSYDIQQQATRKQ